MVTYQDLIFAIFLSEDFIHCYRDGFLKKIKRHDPPFRLNNDKYSGSGLFEKFEKKGEIINGPSLGWEAARGPA